MTKTLTFEDIRLKLNAWADAVETYLYECRDMQVMPDLSDMSLIIYPKYPVSRKSIKVADVKEQLSAYVASCQSANISFKDFISAQSYHIYKVYAEKRKKLFPKKKAKYIQRSEMIYQPVQS